jgi:integrase
LLDADRNRSPQHYLFFLTAIGTGARLGELLAAKWGDFQLGDGDVIVMNKNFTIQRSVDNSGNVTPTKTNRIRQVPLNDDLLVELRKVKAQRLK